MRLAVDRHPSLRLGAFTTEFPAGAGSPDWLTAMLAQECEAPLERSEGLRLAVRDLLRHGGYKPTGRGKPASEYLVRAASEGKLTSINLAVDACNVVSLHSGLPISVVDLDRAAPPLRIGIAAPEAAYVFNQAGQTIEIGGLLCLFDEQGPCANAVKDSQRTKTSPATRRTLSLIWGTGELPGRAAVAEAWYRDLLQAHGATVETPQMS